MRQLIVVVLWSLALSGWAFAAEPVVQSKTTHAKTTHTASTQAKTPAAKPTASQQAHAKAKPATPKYHYARASSLAPLSSALVADPAAVAHPPMAEPAAGDVHTGRMVCELGNTVTITPDPQQSARFIVQTKKNTYLMSPVTTTTGAVRLEDAQAGTMWLQLPHKSMLMNSKQGQRMADECQSPHQMAVAQRMKLDPPPGLLEQPTLAKK